MPAGEALWHNITLLFDGTLIDLFAIHWSQLEQMAAFESVNCTLLENSEILYQRTDGAGRRFAALRQRMHALQEPQARAEMLGKAQRIFQTAAYQLYLLRRQVPGERKLAAMHHAQSILKIMLHTLAVTNQACIDTRKRAQILALPKLPPNFSRSLDAVMIETDPQTLLQESERLMDDVRRLLLAEQQIVQRSKPSPAAVLEDTYPEFFNDIQHIMLAAEREDAFTFNLMSTYHEVMIHLAWARTGVAYSDFNSFAEYEQDLAALSFPALLPAIEAGDYAALHTLCLRFDASLRAYLEEQGVPLNEFAGLAELRRYLDGRPGPRQGAPLAGAD